MERRELGGKERGIEDIDGVDLMEEEKEVLAAEAIKDLDSDPPHRQAIALLL